MPNSQAAVLVHESSPTWTIPVEQPSLGEGDVHLWRISVDSEQTSLDLLRESLSADEKKRALNFRFAADQHRYITARGSLREILSGYLGLSPAEVAFHYTNKGKPFLDPEIHEEIVSFNLAHSGQVALCAVARGRDVGVDVEQIRANVPNKTVAEYVFSPHERAAVHELPESKWLEAFFTCWTLKEAYAKGRGDGLSMDLALLDVWSGNLSQENTHASRVVHLDGWTLYPVVPGDGYIGALAVEGSGWLLKNWQWRARPVISQVM